MLKAETEYPFEGEYVQVGDYTTHVIRYQSSAASPTPTCLYVHGSSGTYRDLTWSPLFPKLKSLCNVIVYDRPGNGLSPRSRWSAMDVFRQAEHLRELIEVLHLSSPPVVIGHSLGGSIVLALAVLSPKSVSGVALLSPVAYPWPGFFGTSLVQAVPPVPGLGELAVLAIFPPIVRFIKPMLQRELFQPNAVDKPYADMAIYFATRPSHYIAATQDVRILRESLRDLSPRYPEITLPMTIVAGKSDEIVNTKIHSVHLHEVVKHSKLLLLKDTGHLPHFARSDEVALQIGNLLAEVRESSNPIFTSSASPPRPLRPLR